MKKPIIILIFLSVGFLAYTQNVFNNVYNDYSYFYTDNSGSSFYNDEYIGVIEQIDDEDILIAGSVSTNTILGDTLYIHQGYLVRLNQLGDTIWTNRYNFGDGIDFIADIFENPDNTFVLFGASDSLASNSYERDGTIIFIDNDGDFQKYYGYDFGRDTQFLKAKSQDGGATFDIIGRVNVSPAGTNYNAFVIRIDSAGNILNQYDVQDFGQVDLLYDIEYLDNGGLMIAGGVPAENPTPLGSADYYILQLDSNYNFVWEFRYDNGGTEVIGTEESLILEEDGIVFCGWSNYCARVTKLDFDGDFVWEYCLPDTLNFHGYRVLRQSSDGHYIAAGETANPIIMVGNSAIGLLTKVSREGEEIWTRYISKYYDEDAYDFLFDMEVAPDGGILLGGYVINSSIHDGDSIFHRNDAWLAKTDSCGYTVGDVPSASFIIDSIVGNTVYITNTSEDYCTATLHFGNGDSIDIYAYSEWTTGENPTQLQYTYADTGTYTITLDALAGDSTASYSQTIEIQDSLVGLPSPHWGELEGGMSLFPNPTSQDYIILQLDTKGSNSPLWGDAAGRGAIYTATGQFIQEIPLIDAYQQRIDVSDLASGVYILSIEYSPLWGDAAGRGAKKIGYERLSIVK